MTHTWDSHLDPPDEKERVDCPDCGEEMEVKEEYPSYNGNRSYYAICNNPFCPSQHTGVAYDMAIKILELEYDLMRLKKGSKNG